MSLAGRLGLLLLALAMPLLPACGAQAEMIEKLPALQGATPLGAEDMAPARDALSAAFEAWLRGTYSVAGVRGFSVPGPDAEWAKWRKRMDNALGDKCRLQQPGWYRPGHDWFAVWTCDGLLRTRHVGLALSPEADAQGRRVLAYFDLQAGPGQ